MASLISPTATSTFVLGSRCRCGLLGVKMFDIGKEPIEFKCPKCGNKLKMTLDDASSGRTVYCASCKTEIRLSTDESVKKSVDSVNKSVKDLEKTFKKLSRH
jgi:hypothetical protein